MTVIWWVRRDLRLQDNPTLLAALEQGGAVLPVFILDERLLARPAEPRQAFLFNGLRALDNHLRHSGSRLVIRAGRPELELAALVQESGAMGIFAEEDYSPFARRRDAQVGERLPLHLVQGLTIFHPRAVVKPDGAPYRVFTPFRNAWQALPQPLRRNEALLLPDLPEWLAPESLPLPERGELPGFPAGEKEAQRRLEVFLEGPVYDYARERDRLDLDGTSALSPYLRFGMLSAGTSYSRALKAAEKAADPVARRGCETWINELIWREFYQGILYHFPQVLKQAFNPGLRQIAWRNAPEDLQAWQAGRTGVPVVDAAMRQLAGSGWMHNRARMITASFLVKDLLINWQEGEKWFMRCLVDGDPAANNGGWQWTAGVGTDSAPYFRIFNPVLQGKKFDPQGAYIRRWVPELAPVPDAYLHEPAAMPKSVQQACGCVIGRDYPAPLIDHAQVRGRVLAAYQAAQRKG